MGKDLLVAIVNVGCHYQKVNALHSFMVIVPDVPQRAIYVHT